ncbi:MAG: Ig-like domain-containing protein, partial [Planctomycetota bacterium]|nr:Ig-like domain-containing protein [Planctomycetota bacterium]
MPDASGNTATAASVFTVDLTPPVITPPADMTVEPTCATGAHVTFAASATDNLTAVPAISYSPAADSTFPVGTTVVTVTATDDAGNSSSATFTVTVTSWFHGAIEITGGLTGDEKDLSGPTPVYFTNSNPARVTVQGHVWITGGTVGSVTFIATGENGSRVTATVSAGGVPDCIVSAPLALPSEGKYEITATARGSWTTFPVVTGPVSSAQSAILYVDHTPPAIALTAPTRCSLTNDDDVVVINGLSTAQNDTLRAERGLNCYNPADFQVRAQATDSSGLTLKPGAQQASIAGPASYTLPTTILSGQPPDVPQTVLCMPPAETMPESNTPPGAPAWAIVRYTYHLSLVDRCGNRLEQDVFKFCVDRTPPQVMIAAPAAGAITNDARTTFRLAFSDSSGVDPQSLTRALDGVPLTTLVGSTTGGAVFDADRRLGEGQHTLSVTAGDRAGYTATATRDFTVDTTPPTVAAPADVTVPAEGAGAHVTFDAATASDTVTPTDRLTIRYSQPSGSFFPCGDTTVTVTATDEAGNAGTAEFKVTVTGTAVPPAFDGLTPADMAWVKEPRPLISGRVSTPGVDLNSLIVELFLIDGTRPVAVSGLTLQVVDDHFALNVPYDLGDASYEARGYVRNTVGEEATTVWHFALDHTAPVITGLPPQQTTIERSPVITAAYSDAFSGIDVTSVVLSFDGAAVEAQVTAAGVRYAAADLACGTHTVTVTVRDVAGNQAVAVGTLTIVDSTVDVTAPVFGAASPARGAYVSCALADQPRLAISYSDTSSGVDIVNPGGVQLQIDGVGVDLPEGAVAADGLSYVLPRDLADGPHTWQVSVTDLAGNGPAVLRSDFNVDSTPPTIADFRALGHILTVTAEDLNGSGIDPASLSVSINDCDYTGYAAFAGFDISVSVPAYIHETEKRIRIALRDYAGNERVFTQTYIEPPATGQTALTHFAYETAEGYKGVPSANFYVPFVGEQTYMFRVAYDPAWDPTTFGSIAGPHVHISGVDTVNHLICFDFGLITAPTAIEPFTLEIRDTPYGGSASYVSGFVCFFEPGNDPTLGDISPPAATTQTPRVPISFQASDDVAVAAVEVRVNGVQVPAKLSTPDPQNPDTLIDVVGPAPLVVCSYVTPLAYPPGPLTISLKATNVAGNVAAVEYTITIADTVPPAISTVVPAAFTNSPRPKLTFTVSDAEGYGVASGKTRLSYTVNGQGAVEGISPMRSYASAQAAGYAYEFPRLAHGSLVSYVIHAEDRTAPPNVTNYTGSFQVDLLAPVVDAFSPPAEAVPSATRMFQFNVSDDCSGVASFTARLTGIGAFVPIAQTEGSGAGTQSLSLSD